MILHIRSTVGRYSTQYTKHTNIDQMLTNIDHRLAGIVQGVVVIDIRRAQKSLIFCENTRNVGVALETVILNQAEDLLQLFRVVDVIRKNVLIQRIPRRSVDKQQLLFTATAG